MSIFKELTLKEDIEYRLFVDEDEEVKKFIEKARLWHPVIRNEISMRLLKGTDWDVMNE